MSFINNNNYNERFSPFSFGVLMISSVLVKGPPNGVKP